MNLRELLQNLSILVQQSKLTYAEHEYFKKGLEELHNKIKEPETK